MSSIHDIVVTKKIESVRTLNTCKLSRLSRKSGNYAIQ